MSPKDAIRNINNVDPDETAAPSKQSVHVPSWRLDTQIWFNKVKHNYLIMKLQSSLGYDFCFPNGWSMAGLLQVNSH